MNPFPPPTLDAFVALNPPDEEVKTAPIQEEADTNSSPKTEKIYCDEKGNKHRADGPAILRADGTKEWWFEGKRHRVDGPAYEGSDGTLTWYLHGQKHREGAPADIKPNGDCFWYSEGKLHREDGAAIEYKNGSRKYFDQGAKHRLDGPAEVLVEKDGSITQNWFFRGELTTDQELQVLVRREVFSSTHKKHTSKNRTETASWIRARRQNIGHMTAQENCPAPRLSPAVKFDDLNRIHCEDGPAKIYSDGKQEWYWHGSQVSEQRHSELKQAANNNTAKNDNVRHLPIVAAARNTIATQESKKDEKKDDSKSNKSDKTEKSAKPNMKQWPEEPDAVLPFDDLWKPLKDLIEAAYKPIARNTTPIDSFTYVGYDLGKIEKKHFPPLNQQFTDKYLASEKTRNQKTLIDTVMRAIFMLGMEQARRLHYQEREPATVNKQNFKELQSKIIDLRYELHQAQAELKLRRDYPNLSESDLESLLQEEMEKTRQTRLQEIRQELLANPRPAFNVKTKKKHKLADLIAVAKSLDPAIVKLEDWKKILQSASLSFQDWQNYCKKQHFNRFRA